MGPTECVNPFRRSSACKCSARSNGGHYWKPCLFDQKARWFGGRPHRQAKDKDTWKTCITRQMAPFRLQCRNDWFLDGGGMKLKESDWWSGLSDQEVGQLLILYHRRALTLCWRFTDLLLTPHSRSSKEIKIKLEVPLTSKIQRAHCECPALFLPVEKTFLVMFICIKIYKNWIHDVVKNKIRSWIPKNEHQILQCKQTRHRVLFAPGFWSLD